MDTLADPVTSTALKLADYGVLGIYSVIMLAALWFVAKMFVRMHSENKERIKDLETRMERYLSEDRKVLLETVQDTRQALENSNNINQKHNILIEQLLQRRQV